MHNTGYNSLRRNFLTEIPILQQRFGLRRNNSAESFRNETIA